MTLGEQVADLQARLRAAQEHALRAQMAAQGAEAAAKAAREQLRDQFGVQTSEDAQRLLDQLRQELDDTIVRLRQGLDEVDA